MKDELKTVCHIFICYLREIHLASYAHVIDIVTIHIMLI